MWNLLVILIDSKLYARIDIFKHFNVVCLLFNLKDFNKFDISNRHVSIFLFEPSSSLEVCIHSIKCDLCFVV